MQPEQQIDGFKQNWTFEYLKLEVGSHLRSKLRSIETGDKVQIDVYFKQQFIKTFHSEHCSRLIGCTRYKTVHNKAPLDIATAERIDNLQFRTFYRFLL